MDIAYALALYFMIWWITVFAVLPWGVRTQAEGGTVEPGTPQSAPLRPRLLKVFLINSVLAAVVFGIVWMAMSNDWLGLYATGAGAVDGVPVKDGVPEAK